MFDDIQERLNARVPDIAYEQRFSLFDRLQLFILEQRAKALLRKTLHRDKPTHVSRLSPHLLKDIGLPPDLDL
jgi:hypothetical protein